MIKTFLCLLLLGSITIAAPAFSQSEHLHQGGGGQQNGPREPDYTKLKTDLGLSDDQVTSWKNLEEQYQPKFKALHSNTTLSDEDKRTQMKQLRSSKEADLKKILTSDQYTKFVNDREKKGRP
jgi:protein CpxP